MRKTTIFVALITLFVSIMALGQDLSVANRGAYIDVPETHWAYPSVMKMTKEGILEGQKVGIYNGGVSVTRYELAMA